MDGQGSSATEPAESLASTDAFFDGADWEREVRELEMRAKQQAQRAEQLYEETVNEEVANKAPSRRAAMLNFGEVAGEIGSAASTEIQNGIRAMYNTIRDRNASQWALVASSANLVYVENVSWAMLAGQGGVLALGLRGVATSEAILQTSEYLAQQLEDSPPGGTHSRP